MLTAATHVSYSFSPISLGDLNKAFAPLGMLIHHKYVKLASFKVANAHSVVLKSGLWREQAAGVSE